MMTDFFRRSVAAMLLFSVPAVVSAQESSRLKIVVVEGENATHNIRRKAVSPTVVEVRDERNRPVAGASVRFMLPERGPGGSFAGGEHVFMSSTDSGGQASLPGFVPNDEEGTFSVAVLARDSGREGQTIVNQRNALLDSAASVPSVPAAATTLAPVPRRSGTGKKLLLMVALGGAAAAVGIIAVGGKGGSSPSAPPTTVGGGGVTVGGPR